MLDPVCPVNFILTYCFSVQHVFCIAYDFCTYVIYVLYEVPNIRLLLLLLLEGLTLGPCCVLAPCKAISLFYFLSFQ